MLLKLLLLFLVAVAAVPLPFPCPLPHTTCSYFGDETACSTDSTLQINATDQSYYFISLTDGPSGETGPKACYQFNIPFPYQYMTLPTDDPITQSFSQCTKAVGDNWIRCVNFDAVACSYTTLIINTQAVDCSDYGLNNSDNDIKCYDHAWTLPTQQPCNNMVCSYDSPTPPTPVLPDSTLGHSSTQIDGCCITDADCNPGPHAPQVRRTDPELCAGPKFCNFSRGRDEVREGMCDDGPKINCTMELCPYPRTTCGYSGVSGTCPPQSVLQIGTNNESYYFITDIDMPDDSLPSACYQFDIPLPYVAMTPPPTVNVDGLITDSFSWCMQEEGEEWIRCVNFHASDSICNATTLIVNPPEVYCNEYTLSGQDDDLVCHSSIYEVPHQDPCHIVGCAWDTKTRAIVPYVTRIPGCCTVNDDCNQQGGGIRRGDQDLCDTLPFCNYSLGERDLEGEGFCQPGPPRDCVVEHCAIDLLCPACNVGTLCSRIDKLVAYLWNSMISGTYSYSNALMIFPECFESLEAQPECNSCLIAHLNREEYVEDLSEFACGNVSYTCETIKIGCKLDESPYDDIAWSMCTDLCQAQNNICNSECTIKYYNDTAKRDACFDDCGDALSPCQGACSTQAVCDACYNVTDFIVNAYVTLGKYGASTIFNQFLSVADLEHSDIAYLMCRFAALDVNATPFGECLLDAECHDDHCNSTTGLCERSPGDICDPDTDLCAINPRCLATAENSHVFNYTDVIPAYGEFYFQYTKAGASCAPCVFELPQPDGVHKVFAIGPAVFTLVGSPLYNETDISDNITSITIYMSLGEYFIVLPNETVPSRIYYGSMHATMYKLTIVTEMTTTLAMSIYGNLTILLEETCDSYDGYPDNDCIAHPDCVDDGRKQCPPPSHNQACECVPATGQCACQYIHCHNCGCHECNDNNLCTLDICNHTNGCCQHEPIDCNEPEDFCQLRVCSTNGGGCQTVWRNLCDDHNGCTADLCNPATGGCSHVPAVYDHSDNEIESTLAQYGKCAYVVCDPHIGTWHVVLIDIDDHRVCTDDSCDPETGIVSHTPHVCGTPPRGRVPIGDTSCFIPTCSEQAGGCAYTILSCNDNNPCTADSCALDSLTCVHTQIDCGCNTLGLSIADNCLACGCSVDGGGCWTRAINCDDKNPCTDDTCSGGICQHTKKDCRCSERGYYLNEIEPDVENMCLLCGCSVDGGGCWTRAVNCDDKDPTTTDTCSTTNGCQHRSIRCPSTGDACFEYPFDRHTGICGTEMVPKNCDDKNLCTIDTCSDGECVHTQKCAPTELDRCTEHRCDKATGQCLPPIPKHCDDHNPCTTDACNPIDGACLHTPVTCPEDPDKCTHYKCSADRGGCILVNKHCDDHNACTVDTCEPSTGDCRFIDSVECDNATIVCSPTTTDLCYGISYVCNPHTGKCDSVIPTLNDNNACTNDLVSVDSTGKKLVIIHEPIVCPNDLDPCLLPIPCDPRSGCVSRYISCDDHNPCTDDSCENPCNDKTCEKNGCIHRKHDCNDNNQSTIDTCSLDTGGCVHVPMPSLGSCNDNDPCTVDTLDRVNALCVNEVRPCISTDLCVIGKCVPTQVAPGYECNFTRKVCDQGDDKCVTKACDPGTGNCVVQSVVTCNDNDGCTTDQCNQATGECHHVLETCGASTLIPTVRTEKQMEPWAYCETRSCDERDGQCYSTPISCDDHDACTHDDCVYGIGCIHHHRHCDEEMFHEGPRNGMDSRIDGTESHNKCILHKCDPANGHCYRERIQCPSSDPRAICSCVPETGKCVCVATVCENPDPCYVNASSPIDGRCVSTPRDCRDDDACTTDVCVRGECTHRRYDCNDNNACTEDTCDRHTGNCVHEPIHCHSEHPGMVAHCNNLTGCAFAPMTGPCNPCQTCFYNHHDGEWERIPKSVSDDNPCTRDVCIDGRILHFPIPCRDEDPCTIDMCNVEDGECLHIPRNMTEHMEDHCHYAVCESCTVEEDHHHQMPPRTEEEHHEEHHEQHPHCIPDEEEDDHHEEREHHSRQGYKFTVHRVRYEHEECSTSTCDPDTGVRVRTLDADGTHCNHADLCHLNVCVHGLCITNGTKVCPHTTTSSTGSSAGQIVAIVVGSIVGVLLLIGGIVWIYRHTWTLDIVSN
jgi:hypothetical protein